MNKFPSGPNARPPGVWSEDALTPADIELVKSTWPITISGAIRPGWLAGRGKRKTLLLPASATNKAPVPDSTTMPVGTDNEVIEGVCDPRVSTLEVAVR